MKVPEDENGFNYRKLGVNVTQILAQKLSQKLSDDTIADAVFAETFSMTHFQHRID